MPPPTDAVAAAATAPATAAEGPASAQHGAASSRCLLLHVLLPCAAHGALRSSDAHYTFHCVSAVHACLQRCVEALHVEAGLARGKAGRTQGPADQKGVHSSSKTGQSAVGSDKLHPV